MVPTEAHAQADAVVGLVPLFAQDSHLLMPLTVKTAGLKTMEAALDLAGVALQMPSRMLISAQELLVLPRLNA